MATAGFIQAGIVQRNILARINGTPLKEYKPISIEGMLKLGLGKVGLLNIPTVGLVLDDD
jgi:hypothetical protein